ncbi:hypothetical protein OIU84_012247 [Salix udensis]|uniref:Heme O synthase n=1 Tax=Salix udensis TaxID=889485 RepID=A0AAD6JFX1_9ROSI|nr:hypothetical protein OIU84_012247 [Salix udensis]
MTCRLGKNELFFGICSPICCYGGKQLVFQKRKEKSASTFPSAEMWRNTCKLLSNPNYNHNLLKSSSYSASNFNVVFGWAPSQATHYYSSPSSATSGSLELGISSHKSDGVRSFSSSSAAVPAIVDHLSSPLTSALQLGRHYSRCYWELSKARLSMLVVATSGTGYVLGSAGSAVDLAGLCWTCAGTMMVASSANSLNQVFEKNNDAKMKRTRLRPLPSRRLTIPHALTWASSVGVAGTAILACKANMLAAGTWSFQSHPLCICLYTAEADSPSQHLGWGCCWCHSTTSWMGCSFWRDFTELHDSPCCFVFLANTPFYGPRISLSQ